MANSVKGVQVDIISDGKELVLMYGDIEICRGPDTRDFGQKTLNVAFHKALSDDIPKKKRKGVSDGD